MRKYRVVVRTLKGKVTRHIRATNRDDAERQARVIADVLDPDGAKRSLGFGAASYDVREVRSS